MKLTDVIRRPLVTEKTTVMREEGQTLVEYGLLLAFMFLGNMLGALVLLPALARIVYDRRRFAS